MESCKEVSTPMPSSCYMNVDVAGKEVDQTKYRGLIGSLLYLTAVEDGKCPDQTSVIDPGTELRHRAPMLGNGRGPQKVGSKRTYQGIG